MKIKFNKAFVFEKVKYAPGVHEIPEKMAKNWFILSMISNRNALIVEQGSELKPEAKVQMPAVKLAKGRKSKKEARAAKDA